MTTTIARIRDAINTSLHGRSLVRCETCGVTLRPGRAVWRGVRPYCSAAHEHADLDISSPVRVTYEGFGDEAGHREGCPGGAASKSRPRTPVRRRDSRMRPGTPAFRAGGF